MSPGGQMPQRDRRNAGAGSPIIHRLAPIVVTAVSLAVIALATLRGGDPRDSRTAWCLLCPPRGSRVGVDLVLNVLLFIPYGFGLGTMRVSRLRGYLVVVLTTLVVEFLQMYVVPGRHSSVADVVTNTLGGILGMALANQARTFIDPAVSRARSLALVGLGAWLALLAASSLAATPSTPSRAYSARWRPGRSVTTGTEGTLVAARVNEVELPPGTRGTHDARLDGLRRGDPTSLEVMFVPALEGGTDARLEILADGAPMRAVVGQNGADVLLRVHLRASDARLRGPTLRITDALGAARGGASRDTVTARAHVSRRLLRVESIANGSSQVRELALGPHLGWSFLLPGRTGLPPMIRAAADALWLAFLLLPVGYWAGRSMRRADDPDRKAPLTGLGLGTAALIVGLWAIPAAIGVTPAPPLAWALAAACLFVGWMAAGWTYRRTRRGNTSSPPA